MGRKMPLNQAVGGGLDHDCFSWGEIYEGEENAANAWNDLANTKGSNGRNSPNVLAFETEKSELADSGVPVQMQLFCNVKFMLMLNGFLLWIAENEVLGFKMNGS